VHQPANVNGELLSLGPGKEHAIIQRVQEPLVRQPPALVHKLAMHDRDLAGRPPKRNEAQLQPKPKRTPKRNITPRGIIQVGPFAKRFHRIHKPKAHRIA